MLIDIPTFLGEIPSRHKRRLPEGAAQVATNAVISSGALRAIRNRTFVTDLVSNRKSVYLDGATWMAWDTHAHAVPGPTATDRIYVTGDGVPKMWASNTWYNLALPGPTAAPTTATLTTPDPDALETVLYVYTFVTAFGEESAPSPISAGLSWSSGVAVRLTGLQTPPAGRNITKLRIYRSQTSSFGTTTLHFVAEITPAASYDHDLGLYPLNEALTTNDHDTPPDDMAGIISMPNGMMVAHTDREILFSEPYQPHAWPEKYRLTVDYDIVGLAAFGPNLAVMTKGTPYRGQGYHPDNFALEKIEENLPCMSARGIVDLGYSAAYPSDAGLVVVSSSGAQVVSRNLFTREQWQNLNPSSIIAGRFDGKYVFGFSGSLPSGAENSGFIDLSGETPFFLRAAYTIQCLYNDIRTGHLYWQTSDAKLYLWDDPTAATYLSATWRSALLDLPYAMGFSAILVEGTELGTSSFQADVIADGSVIHTITDLNTPVRLPAGEYTHWEIEVRGMVEISSIAMASSLTELSGRR